jgi:hypothetical protein
MYFTGFKSLSIRALRSALINYRKELRIMLANLIFAVLAVEGESGNLLDVNPGLIFWTVITFLILLLILKKLAWKPILRRLTRGKIP